MNPKTQKVGQNLQTRQLFTLGSSKGIEALYQWLSLSKFRFRREFVPRSEFGDRFFWVKGSKSKFLGGVFLILHIKPLSAPPLDRISHKKVEVFKLGTNRDYRATNIVDGGASGISPNRKNALPEPPVTMDAKKALAKGR